MDTSRRPDDPKLSKGHFVVRLGFLIQLLAFILSFVSFFAPFWHVELNTLIRVGLWGRCDDVELECIWFLQRNYAWEKSLPGWHVAAQVLFAIGIGVLFISCMWSICNLMFKCCRIQYKRGLFPIIFGILVAVAMIFETLSITVYGIGAYQNYECSLNSWVARFEWAFYVGIAGLFVCLVSSLLLIYGGLILKRDMKGYTDKSLMSAYTAYT